MLGERVLQVWWWYLHGLEDIARKREGGLEIAPPVGRGLTFLLPPPPPEENPIRDRISAAPSLWQMFIQQIMPILFSIFSNIFYIGSFSSAFKYRLNFLESVQ